MKRKILVIALLLASSTFVDVRAEVKEELKFHESWEAALKEAKESKKPIFVDFYTTWCGPCVWMKKNTFTDAEVIKYFNSNFISIKIDCDLEGEELQELADVTAYPTLGFFNSNGEFVTKAVGAYGPEDFLELGKSIVDGMKDTKPLSGLDDKNFQFKFNQLKNSDPEKAERLAKEWLDNVTYEDISNEKVWFLVNEYLYNTSDPLVLDIIDNLAELNETYDISDYLEKLITNLIDTELSIRDQHPSQNYKDMYYRIAHGLKADKNPEEYYHLMATIYFYNASSNQSGLLENLKILSEKYEYDSWESLVENIELVIERYNKEEQLIWADKWADRAIELDENAYTLFSKAQVLGLKNERELAKKYAEKAAEAADDFNLYSRITDWISYLE